MKIKNIAIIALLITCQAMIGTELEIINGTGGIMDAEPIISLAGKVSTGKVFENISNESGVKYNSGVYKFIGMNIRLKIMTGDRKGYNVLVGRMENWPSIDVTNRNARFVLGWPEYNMYNVGRVYLNKNNPADIQILLQETAQPSFVRVEDDWVKLQKN